MTFLPCQNPPGFTLELGGLWSDSLYPFPPEPHSPPGRGGQGSASSIA